MSLTTFRAEIVSDSDSVKDRRPPPVGKAIHGRLYVHRSVWPLARQRVRQDIRDKAGALLARTEDVFNVIRVYETGREVAFLVYADFFDDPFPRLLRSRVHNLDIGAVKERAYGSGGNPPILHRKELLLAPDDPRRESFEALTRTLEEAGLFAESNRIGYLKAWQQRLEAAGFTPDGQRAA